MSWSVRQTRRFARIYKKLHDNVVAEVDAAIETVAQNPDIGEKKKGDLSDLWVYKFRCLGQLYLLGYTRDDGIRLVYLEAVGPHEDFYRDLKRSGKRDVEGLARTGLLVVEQKPHPGHGRLEEVRAVGTCYETSSPSSTCPNPTTWGK